MLGSALLSAPREKLVNQKEALVDTGQTQGTGWVTMAPQVGTEKEAVVHHGRRRASHAPHHASLSTWSEGCGSSAQMGWGQGTCHPGSTCPPAPSPHIRGGAHPVQSWQIPSEHPPCGQAVLSQTAPAQDLNPKLKPLDAVPALPVLRERPWVQEVHPARSDPGEQTEGGLEGSHRKDVPH